MYWKKLIIHLVWLCSLGCVTTSKNNNNNFVYWHSPQGIIRLSNSHHKADFSRLSNQFQNQVDGLTCGPTTGAIILNALYLGQTKSLPKTTFNETYRKHLSPNYDPRVARYTPESFMNEKTQKIKSLSQLYGQPINGQRDFGLQIRQLHNIFLAHRVNSQLRVVDKNLSDQQARQELIANLGREGDYVIINYKRSALNQKGGGHISPLGAYDENTDSFLIMDVNSSKYHWVWIKSTKLIQAMRTFDTVENRGYLLISHCCKTKESRWRPPQD